MSARTTISLPWVDVFDTHLASTTFRTTAPTISSEVDGRSSERPAATRSLTVVDVQRPARLRRLASQLSTLAAHAARRHAAALEARGVAAGVTRSGFEASGDRGER